MGFIGFAPSQLFDYFVWQVEWGHIKFDKNWGISQALPDAVVAPWADGGAEITRCHKLPSMNY